MLPNKVLVASYSNVANERPVTSGLVHALHVTVEGLEAGGHVVKEAAAKTILSGIVLDVSRTFANGETVQIVDDVTADFFRRKSNAQGGVNLATQGALIPLGPHNLDGSDDSELVIGYDREEVDETEFSESIDTSNAKIRIRRVQFLEAVPPVLYQYLADVITRPSQKATAQLRGDLSAIYYDGDTLEEHTITVNGTPRTIPADFTEMYSAATSRHEQVDAAPLMKLYDADMAFARAVSPDIEVEADTSAGDRMVSVGTFTN